MPRLKYYVAAISAAVIWGFFAISLRHLKAYEPEQILYYRVFTSLGVIWAVVLLQRKTVRQDLAHWKALPSAGKLKLLRLTLLAGVLITANWFTFIYAVNHVSLQSAAFAYMVCPLITALAGYLLLKEHLSAIKFAALGIALVSIALLARGSFTDVIWAVTIALFYAGYLIIQRVVRQFGRLTVLAIHLLVATLVLLPFFFTRFVPIPQTVDFWINILLIAVVFTIIPLFLTNYSLNGLPSSTLGIIIYVNPLVSFTVAICYFHEHIRIHQALAYSLLLIAVVVFNWEVIRRSLSRTPGTTGHEQPDPKNTD